MAQTYKCIIFQERPKGAIDPSKVFRTEERPIPAEADLKDGEVLVQNTYLSLDPAMRGWMNDTRSYLPPVPLNSVMRGGTVGRVVASKFPDLQKGDNVFGSGGWSEYSVLPGKELYKVGDAPGANLSDWLGVLGFTGLTAYFGLLDIGGPKAGDLVVVSGAAGATGSIVCQIAKIKGARVVGIAGAADKVEWLRELGCDVALNYKDADFDAQFLKATEGYIDVYFDNVGGKILDLALGQAQQFSRFVQCGAISAYNAAGDIEGPKNYTNVIKMRIKWQGFIVFDYVQRFPEARKQLASWLAEGKLQRKETIVRGGLEKAPESLVSLYSGINTGKLLVELTPP